MNRRDFHISEPLLALLTSLGLRIEATDLCLIITDEHDTITRLDPEQVPIWLKGYLAGRSR